MVKHEKHNEEENDEKAKVIFLKLAQRSVQTIAEFMIKANHTKSDVASALTEYEQCINFLHYGIKEKNGPNIIPRSECWDSFKVFYATRFMPVDYGLCLKFERFARQLGCVNQKAMKVMMFDYCLSETDQETMFMLNDDENALYSFIVGHRLYESSKPAKVEYEQKYGYSTRDIEHLFSSQNTQNKIF